VVCGPQFEKRWCKVKTRCPCVNDVRASGWVIASRFLNLRTMWDDKTTLLPDKIPRYPLNRRLRGPQSRSGHLWREETSPPVIESRFSARSPSLYPNRHSDYAIPALCIGRKCWIPTTTVTRNQTGYADYSVFLTYPLTTA